MKPILTIEDCRKMRNYHIGKDKVLYRMEALFRLPNKKLKQIGVDYDDLFADEKAFAMLAKYFRRYQLRYGLTRRSLLTLLVIPQYACASPSSTA